MALALRQNFTENKELTQQLARAGLGDHLCLIYENAEEQMAAVVPYMRQGLERNELCIYIADDRTLDEVRAALECGGIDVDAELASGRLAFATKREAYLKSGKFDPNSMLEYLAAIAADALEKGYTGFRVTGEMTWGLGSECGCDRLMEYEALLNNYFPGSKATAICQYNKNRFSPEMIRDVLRTHPVAILGEEVCDNLYFETPEMILGHECASKRTDWMIDGLRRHRKTERSLQKAIELRDEFLSIASHELNTPITSLKLQTQGLQRLLSKNGEHATIPREKLQKTLDTTERQVSRLSKLISNLLDVTRIGSGRMSLEPEDVDLADLIADVVDRTSDQARASGSVIKLNVSEPITGNWDRFKLEQVFLNLLTNALKFGSGKPVEVSLSSTGEKAVVSVRDQGIGIEAEDLSRIFERFERAVCASTVSGLGLGLFIAREIVETHGGMIRVESAPDEGSTFLVELPLAQT